MVSPLTETPVTTTHKPDGSPQTIAGIQIGVTPQGSLGQSLAFALTGHPLTLNDQSPGQVSPLSPHDHGFPGGSDGKASAYKAGDQGSIPGSERSPGEGNGHPTHSSILAWKTTWAEEPCGLQSMGSERVRHDRATDTHPPMQNFLPPYPGRFFKSLYALQVTPPEQ